MRGKVVVQSAEHFDQGITPAYAGKSKIVKRFWVSVSGSPPPMRGKASRLLSA